MFRLIKTYLAMQHSASQDCPSRHSTTRSRVNRRQRRGVSLIEVTFAIGVVTVGLLGVIALMPLAAHHARQGDITDRAAVLGQSMVEEIDMRGYRRPDMWLAWSPKPSARQFTPFRPGPGLANWQVYDYTTNAYIPSNSLFGDIPGNPGAYHGNMVQAFCIDPRFLNANIPDLLGSSLPSTLGTPRASFFPYYPPTHPSTIGASIPRMTRITLKASPVGNNPLSFAQANQIFVSGDDLAVEFPKDENVYSYTWGFNEGKDGGWGVADFDDDGANGIDDYGEAGWTGADDEINNRTAKGEFSWMATLAPKLDLTQATRSREEYTLSVVVFHNRDPLMVMDDKNEKVANVASFVSGGYGGGVVILEAPDPAEDEHILGDVRRNNWVMLAADSIAGPIFRWYRVSSADTDQVRGASTMPFNGGGTVWRRQITLEGPDWTRPEWQDATRVFYTQATLVSGVVAVYEKTIRLESSSLWSQ